jgi:hypothetical protein
MLVKENFEMEHIRSIRQNTKCDPILIERILYAFGLLEAISRVGMPFVFKGGTSLMLLLEHPLRMSTDIDILVAPETNIDKYIDEAAEIFPFKSVEEQHRIGKSGIVKRHFKFHYDSPNLKSEFYILLDVVFASSPYEVIKARPIKNDLLLTDGNDVFVQIPSIDCILGDKLTAFAPHTTGVKFGNDKELEIIKQLFDISRLIDYMTNQNMVAGTYAKVVQKEIEYRGIKTDQKDVLLDTINTAFCIVNKGYSNQEDYRLLMSGIKAIATHIIEGKYSGEKAAVDACKVIYLSSCLLSGSTFSVIEMPEEYINVSITDLNYRKINYMKKMNLTAYGYLVEAVRLLQS